MLKLQKSLKYHSRNTKLRINTNSKREKNQYLKILNRNLSKATLKRYVFRWRLKMSILSIKRSSDGREFHSLGAAT